jgi:polar amino acid transport system substrate-binding protein
MWRIFLLAIFVSATLVSGGASAQPTISSEIAPTGSLRVAVNRGNTQLVTRAPDGTIVGGLVVDLGKFIAGKLGVSFEPVAYANVNAYTESFGKGEWDIAIGPPTPLIAEKADLGPG